MENVVMLELKKQIEEAGSQNCFANYYQISPSYVSDILSGRRPINSSIADMLGFDTIITYKKRK